MERDSPEFLEHHQLVFFVNGKKVRENNPDPEWTLLYYLRYKLHLCGTKEGCSEGGCGACTVMISRQNQTSKTINNMAINACLTPLCSVHGAAIVTVEGIGSLRTGLHPVQERIAKSHGSQCGFCTPGFVMSMYSLLRNNAQPSETEMETAFQGNLCRCTGYRPILQGFKTFCKPEGCCRSPSQNGVQINGYACCKQGNHETKNGVTGNYKEISQTIHDESEFKPYDPSQDPIFPSELQLQSTYEKTLVRFKSSAVAWHRPVNIEQLLELKQRHPEAKIVGGNTEIGVDVKFKKIPCPHYIHVTDNISELKSVQVKDDGISFGGAVTLSNLQSYCHQFSKNCKHSGNVYQAIADILQWFGGQQIRNVATIGGNLVTASPISDLNPILIASGSSATFLSKARGSRVVKINQEFFPGYRKTVIAPDEILLSVFIPRTDDLEYFWAAKQARRKDDDIAIVNSAMRVQLSPKTGLISEAVLVYGGMGPTTKVATRASSHLISKKLNSEVVEDVLEVLRTELHLEDNAPGGMPKYRNSLAVNFFFKFYLHFKSWKSVSRVYSGRNGTEPEDIRDFDKSALRDCFRPPEIQASQLFQIVPNNQSVEDLVGRPIVHAAGLKHATGEAIYVDDTPLLENELFGAFVLSTRARGKLINIDASQVLRQPGVVAFFDAKDIPRERNSFGAVVKDEDVFAKDEVLCCGQILGLIVAKSQSIAEKVVDLVQVTYEDLPGTIVLTIEDAIKQKSFFSTPTLKSGNIKEGLEKSARTIEGAVRIGGQEHFYMETQSCIVFPKEDDELEILLATQSPSHIQSSVSFCLGVASHKIVVRCRRMGGGFGGKETRTAIIAVATAIAAQKLRRPVRCVLNRVEDMKISGFRHPFLCCYKVGFESDGKINAIHAEMYANAGISLDLSNPVMTRAMMTVDGGYNVPHWNIEGYVCRTNLPSNTAFRGFGGPQASFLSETILDHVGAVLKLDPSEIRRMQLYENGHMTPFDLILDQCTVAECWDECIQMSNFAARKMAVLEFNKENRWKKRGLSMLPTKHLIGFTESFLNQAGALVMVYRDGSVSLNHGGTEMGQGLHTKMIQIASRVLGISADHIYFSESSTDKVPNTSSSAGSLTSDLNGPAVIDACQKLLTRLAPYKAKNPGGKWEDWVNAAYFDRVNLSATGFHSLQVGFDLETKKGIPCNYITYGVGCSEIEIDCLTGDHTVLRTDIVMDLGESLNPAIDIGQIEGGFVQGYGLFTLEELLFSPTGNLLTKGPGMYKIPSVSDIPKEFHVSLLRGAPNPRAVYSSKAVGEPPLFLGASVFFAIKEAIRSAREDNNLSSAFRLDAPATAERILLACQGQDPPDLYPDGHTTNSSENANAGFPRVNKQGWSIIV